MRLIEESKAFTFLTLSEIKKHLHINDAYTDDDGYINTLLEVATRVVENDTSFIIADTVFKLTDKFERVKRTQIETGNIRDITSISLDGSVFTDYTVEISDYKTVITFDSSVSGDIEIVYNAGYLAEETNKILEQCILIKIFGLYDNERSEYNTMNYYKNDVYNNLVNFYRNPHFL